MFDFATRRLEPQTTCIFFCLHEFVQLSFTLLASSWTQYCTSAKRTNHTSTVLIVIFAFLVCLFALFEHFVSGWYDIYARSSVELYDAFCKSVGRDKCRLILGPWLHTGNNNSVFAFRIIHALVEQVLKRIMPAKSILAFKLHWKTVLRTQFCFLFHAFIVSRQSFSLRVGVCVV